MNTYQDPGVSHKSREGDNTVFFTRVKSGITSKFWSLASSSIQHGFIQAVDPKIGFKIFKITIKEQLERIARDFIIVEKIEPIFMDHSPYKLANLQEIMF